MKLLKLDERTTNLLTMKAEIGMSKNLVYHSIGFAERSTAIG